MAALSLATDLGMGQPVEHALTTCIVAVRLAGEAGLSDDEQRDVYYEALLRYIGCNADTYWLASIVGDELAFRNEYARLDAADHARVLDLIARAIRLANAEAGAARTAEALAQGVAQLPAVQTNFLPGHCEVAARLATRLNFPAGFVRAVGQIYARWDGKGVPALQGEAISPALLVASLAQDVVIFYRLGGVAAATVMARERSGSTHAPHLVELFCRRADHLLAGLDDAPVWDVVLGLEPGPRRVLDEAEFDNACAVIADFVDIKSPFFLNHSQQVAELAAEAAAHCGLPAADVATVRRAGWLHDVGKVGVSAGIWSKPGPLTDREWEAVRLHPYYTERVLARPSSLARIGALAGLHHERLDGSGYYRNLPGPMLSLPVRILAAANRYCALTETRSHRPAYSPEVAEELLKREVRAGLLDGDAANAVLAGAGRPVRSSPRGQIAGLTEREIEVLRLIARGQTMKQVAGQLVISPKTVDRHIQNIYTKIGVSTRAGATLFAMENNLLA
jgi:response regulator RpfG family c-di-GMP phosphodiesterase/DNA-binding CsgD family transcriptional regulator